MPTCEIASQRCDNALSDAFVGAMSLLMRSEAIGNLTVIDIGNERDNESASGSFTLCTNDEKVVQNRDGETVAHNEDETQNHTVIQSEHDER